jgi:hypothetical protein
LGDFDMASFDKSVFNSWAATRIQAIASVQKWVAWVLRQLPAGKSGGFLTALIPGRQDPDAQRDAVLTAYRAVLLHRLDVCKALGERKEVRVCGVEVLLWLVPPCSISVSIP